ncbi:hypothetical protein V498_04334 [Pseudogymnoascus sp. VKM F-4517 (FW-2822)]|nr:hypothetical protein V498_04334 [Pseudogymnoascus sp. VKM F-4517 (FW-2822)]
MVDICERPMDDDGDADCPICLATLSFSALRIHLATHLEELALFVLPCHMENWSQDVGSDKVEGATGQCVASNASGSEDGLPPLDFEKSLSSQDPGIFSTHLQSTAEFEHKGIEDWIPTDDQPEQRDNKDSILAIAKGYRDQGRWGEAEELEDHVMEMSKMELEADHPDMLASIASQQDVGQTQQQRANQQQKPGQPQPPQFNHTEEQVASLTQMASLTHDQRMQYIWSTVQIPDLPAPEDILFLSIRQEEITKFKALDDLPMNQYTRQAVADLLVSVALKLSYVSIIAPHWFTITRNENQLRAFFCTQIKVAQQFEDPSMQTLKQSLSMGIKDIDEALVIAQNMMADMRDKYPDVSRSRGDDEGLAVSQAPATSSTPQPPVPQVPLNEANPGNSSEQFEVVVSNEFKERSVFKVVWTSPNNSARGSRKNNSDYSKISNFVRTEQGYTSIRRFVVWKNHEGHALCLPILTYRNRGTAMPGVEPAHHAIIFTESKYGHLPRSIRHPPFKDRDELPLPNAPICVEPIDPKHQFDVMSRLNYAELYKVEHGIKVYFIGRIHEASVKEFEASYERVQQMVNALKVQRRVHEMYRGDDGVQKEEDGEDVHPDNRNFMY